MIIPLALFAALAGVLSFSARDFIRPEIEVWVVPVIAKPLAATATLQESTEASRSLLAQAPCWFEPSPYAVTVPALISGVVTEVLVLEGDRVEKDQVVARLRDEDARLAAQRAAAELGEREADVERARVDIEIAALRVDELRDEVTRMRPLVPTGAAPAGEFTRLELRLRGVEQEVVALKAQLARAEAALRTHKVMCDEAELAVERTQIRATSAGVVLSRFVEPGSRLDTGEKVGDRMAADVLRIYDPANLQVRADVPLADSARIAVGLAAEITTEALPDVVFQGRVTLVGHEANIQRNTIPVKVKIENPSPALKPEMLGRVRFFSTGTTSFSDSSAGASGLAPQTHRLLVSQAALLDHKGEQAVVWLIDANNVAHRREIGITGVQDGFAAIRTGLNVGDRLVVQPPAGLTSGVRVKVLGERVTGAIQ